MTTILKGDTTAEITLALAGGYDYSGKTVHLEYQGARRSFSGVTAGGVLAFSFTAAETAPMSLGAYPVRVWLEDGGGCVDTIHNAEVRLRVTDCAAEVHTDSAIYLDVRGGLYGIEGLPERFTDEDLRSKVNEILRRLGGTVAMAVLALLPAYGATVEVQTAPKGAIFNDQQVVTNVVLDASDKADITNVYTKAETDARIVELAPAPDFSTNNAALVATIEAKAPPTDISGKQDRLPYPTNEIPQAAISGLAQSMSTKQDALPYPTNAIPYSVITDVPTETDPTVPAWAKSETPPQTMRTNDVCNIITNEVVAGEEWVIEAGYPNFEKRMYYERGKGWRIEFLVSEDEGWTWEWIPFTDFQGDENSVMLIWNDDTRAYRHTHNALGLARLVDLPQVTNGIPESIAAATTTNAAQSAQIGQIGQTVNAWEGYWDGTNVILEVTNYYGNTSGELPRLRIKEYRNNSWTNVWDEARKFEVCESNLLHAVSASNAACRAACSAELAEGLAGRAPLAWGTFTDKGTTNVVGNSVWMTSPETYFAGGTEYQRVAVGSGTVCVLTDNGALSKTVGEPGTFRFQDDGGTNYFGFAKSDSYTIGCRTDDISVEGTLITLRYDVIMGGNDVPIIYWREFIERGSWVQLNNSDGTATDGSPYTVTWYQSGGSYYAAINCGENATGFFKAETSVAGDVVFETNMKFRAGGGIECTNTAAGVMGVIKPVYNGSSVSWTWSVK